MSYKVEAWPWCADYCKKNKHSPYDSYFWDKAMLEYRREHNIFEVGDKVVFHSLPYARLFYVKAVLDDSIIVRECWDEAGARCFSEFKPYLDIRHANPEEIAAGHRL